MPYQILNWEKYQGWKSEHKKRPDKAVVYPWLKLYRKTIDSMDFFSLPEQIRWQWFALLCLSDDNGIIAEDDRTIAWRLRIQTFDPSFFLGKLLKSEGDPLPIRSESATDPLPIRLEERRGEDINHMAQPNPTATPVGVTKKRRKPRINPNYPTGFERVWAKYPHKEAKLKALPNWNDLNPDEETICAMENALIAQAKAGKWVRRRPDQQLLQFQGWLSGRRWEDEVSQATPKEDKWT